MQISLALSPANAVILQPPGGSSPPATNPLTLNGNPLTLNGNPLVLGN